MDRDILLGVAFVVVPLSPVRGGWTTKASNQDARVPTGFYNISKSNDGDYTLVSIFNGYSLDDDSDYFIPAYMLHNELLELYTDKKVVYLNSTRAELAKQLKLVQILGMG